MKPRNIAVLGIMAVGLSACGGSGDSMSSTTPPMSSTPPSSSSAPMPTPTESYTVDQVEALAGTESETSDPVTLDSSAMLTPVADETSDPLTLS